MTEPIQYDPQFIREEERNGYLVSEKMKKVWSVQLNLLAQLDRCCKEHGIRYFADYGTLLGAVRHKGFIPWDDDIDVTMLRPDYMRFIEIAPVYFSEPYFFQNYFTDHNNQMTYDFAKLRDERTAAIKEPVAEYPDYHQGIHIDIFPLDIAPEKDGTTPPIIEIAQELWITAAQPRVILDEIVSGNEPRAGTDMILDVMGMPIEDRIRLFDGFMLSNYDKQDTINRFSEIVKSAPCRKEWYEDTVELPFEHINIPAPAGYENILRARYGDYTQIRMYASEHEIDILDPDRSYREYGLPVA